MGYDVGHALGYDVGQVLRDVAHATGYGLAQEPLMRAVRGQLPPPPPPPLPLWRQDQQQQDEAGGAASPFTDGGKERPGITWDSPATRTAPCGGEGVQREPR